MFFLCFITEYVYVCSFCVLLVSVCVYMCDNYKYYKYYSTALTPVFGVNVDTVDRKPAFVGRIDLSH